jgi:2-C-methyl-D-erythritol 4-phosphate cytidylyltransferase
MGAGIKKELECVNGTPVLRLAFQAFLTTGRFNHIAVTYPKGKKPEMAAALEGTEFTPLFVEGGATRQESVFRALIELAEFTPDYVLIHDGSRPWVSASLIERVLDGTVKHGACLPVVPVTDALKQIADDGSISDHLDKNHFSSAQTPQGFNFSKILEAHRVARSARKDYSDDAEAYHQAIGPVFSTTGEPGNRKITYEFDLP